jgi:hypothetical protein
LSIPQQEDSIVFYSFRQNNSGGRFVFDEKDGISVLVVVEADSAEQAENRAESIGIYFDGCDAGIDCPCCGDRWYRPYDGAGTETPCEYDNEDYLIFKDNFEECDGYFGTVPPAFVHYKDGRIVPAALPKRTWTE